MKSDRNNFSQMMPFQPGMMPANMMMMPGYMNDNMNNIENRISSLEKKVKTLDTRLSRLETPYPTNGGFQEFSQTQTSQNMTIPYQTTQGNNNYNGEMYMM